MLYLGGLLHRRLGHAGLDASRRAIDIIVEEVQGEAKELFICGSVFRILQVGAVGKTVQLVVEKNAFRGRLSLLEKLKVIAIFSKACRIVPSRTEQNGSFDVPEHRFHVGTVLLKYLLVDGWMGANST